MWLIRLVSLEVIIAHSALVMGIVDFVIHVRIYVIALRLPAVQIVQTVLDVSQEHLMGQRKDMNAEWNGKCHLGFLWLNCFPKHNHLHQGN